jgi:replication factor C subunit 3/5
MEPAEAAPTVPTVTVGGLEVLPWVEKYRPQALAETLGHQDIITTIQRFVETGTLPHLLLHGPPGTGKTTTIKACAKKMFGPRYSSLCLELNASDERGINVVREQIRSFASAQQLFASKHPKLVILDEADHMTSQAQFALRRIIEDYHKNTRFCLIGNYASKIIPALQSRCTRFRFQPLGEDQVKSRVAEICTAEKVSHTPDGLEALATVGRGDMRKVLNILQATSMAHGDVTLKAVYLTTGTPLPEDLEALFATLMQAPFAEALKVLETLRVEKGYSLADLLRGVFDLSVEIQMPAPGRLRLMPALAEIEHRLSRGATDKVQAAALVGVFIEVREILSSVPRQ